MDSLSKEQSDIITFFAFYDDNPIRVCLKSDQLLEELKMNIFSVILNAEYQEVRLILENYGDLSELLDLPLSCLSLGKN